MPPVVSARKAQSANVAWFAEVVEAPRLSAPDTNALSRRQRRYRFVVWMCVILTPVAMIAMLASTTHHTSKTPVAASSGAASSAGKVAAMIQVEKWLKSTPNPLPNGRIVSWDGAYDIPSPREKVPRCPPSVSRSR